MPAVKVVRRCVARLRLCACDSSSEMLYPQWGYRQIFTTHPLLCADYTLCMPWSLLSTRAFGAGRSRQVKSTIPTSLVRAYSLARSSPLRNSRYIIILTTADSSARSNSVHSVDRSPSSSDKPLRTEYGYWRITGYVSLIGPVFWVRYFLLLTQVRKPPASEETALGMARGE